jgi:peptide/nickel transport system permease protein
VSRVVEAVLCIPSLLVALALLAATPPWLSGLSDPLRIAVVLSVTGWTPASRYLRGEFLRLRTSDMVAAARSSGAGQVRIALRHVLPSAVTPVLVTAAFSVGGAILLEAALSFLGLGVSPPTATWGGLLRDARNRGEAAWWLTLFPGICLFLAVLSCNLVGEGLRDLLDPRSKR